MFVDRDDAGRQLADKLRTFIDGEAVVYGLPRGGLHVALVVARVLACCFDLIVTRKIGHPANREYAIGAVSEDGVAIWNELEASQLPVSWLDEACQREYEEALRRRQAYLPDVAPISVEGKIAIAVDDGIATGYTMEAAVRALRDRDPARLIVAAPVAPKRTVERFAALADRVVVVMEPDEFFAIGQFYHRFPQLDDADVRRLLADQARMAPGS